MADSSRGAFSWLIVVLIWGLIVSGSACGEDLNFSLRRNKEKADWLVRTALIYETRGNNAERDDLLKLALAFSPDHERARWHSGFVRSAGAWMRPSAAIASFLGDSTVKAYHARRDSMPDTAQAHLVLANWCAANDLPRRERAHLTRVLHHDQDDAEARRRLGFQRVDRQWVDRKERAKRQQRSQLASRSLDAWRSQMKAIHVCLLVGSDNVAAGLLKECDASSIDALEQDLAPRGERDGLLAVERLSSLPIYESTRALAGLAVDSPWEPVRDAASKTLSDRDWHEFVPQLMTRLLTPLQQASESASYRNGRLTYRKSLEHEAADRQHRVIHETSYRRVAREGGNRRETMERVVDRMWRDIHAHRAEVAEQNRQLRESNERIVRVLQRATGHQLPARPETWWAWWNDYNEVYVEGDKPEYVGYKSIDVEIEDEVPIRVIEKREFMPRFESRSPRTTRDCLAAGTPIWTDRGPVAVESVQIGDLVLAQSPATGRLAWEPVARTTVRPPSTLVRLQIGDETIDASGGHPFWVAGRGWMKARELRADMELHGLDGARRIRRVESLPDAVRTYNLEVSGSHTYFVGEARLFSHDNTIRRPTNAIVPGL